MHYHESHSNLTIAKTNFNRENNDEMSVKKEELENDCWDNSFDYGASYDQDVSRDTMVSNKRNPSIKRSPWKTW